MAPEGVRYVGMWVNAITAVIALGVVLTLMQVDMATYTNSKARCGGPRRGDFRLHYQRKSTRPAGSSGRRRC